MLALSLVIGQASVDLGERCFSYSSQLFAKERVISRRTSALSTVTVQVCSGNGVVGFLMRSFGFDLAECAYTNSHEMRNRANSSGQFRHEDKHVGK